MYPTYLPIYFLLLFADPRNYRVGTASCNRRKITPGVDRHCYFIIRIPSEHLLFTPIHHSFTPTLHADATTTHSTSSERANYSTFDPVTDVKNIVDDDDDNMLYIIIIFFFNITIAIILCAVRSRGIARKAPMNPYRPRVSCRRRLTSRADHFILAGTSSLRRARDPYYLCSTVIRCKYIYV